MRHLVRLAVGTLMAATVPASAQQFVAPPRTITDITAILDQEKPKAWVAPAKRVMAEIQPSDSFRPAELAQFYYERCKNNSAIGELSKAIADCEKAEAIGRKALRAEEL